MYFSFQTSANIIKIDYLLYIVLVISHFLFIISCTDFKPSVCQPHTRLQECAVQETATSCI